MKYALKLEDILAILENPKNTTPFEKSEDITNEDLVCLIDRECLKIYLMEKSDGTRSIALVFRTTKNMDSWLIWMITEEQAEFMNTHFETIYKEIDAHNKKKREELRAKSD
jgi:hypothetical protein